MGTQLYTPSSNSIIHNTKVDFTNRPIQKPINLVQYDRNMPIIAVSLYKNGLIYSLPAGMTVKIRWGKRDRTFVYKDALGCNTERNIIFFDVDEQMTYFHGKLDPIIELVDSSGSTPTMAGSSSIPVIIERNPIQESDIQSTSEYADLGGNYIEIKYADLVALRNSNNLKKGAFYRITDYETTTVQPETQSAGHDFDIIVQALDEKTLSEDARATHRGKGELLPWFEHNSSDPAERFFYVDSVVIEGLTLYRWVSYEELYAGNWTDEHISNYLLTEKKDISIGDVVWGYQIIDDGSYSDFSEDYREQNTINNVGEGYMSGSQDYFSNSKLEAWELKYCLDNDANRFAWADEVNGKGVIYRMIDELNNDVPYDFKNIQFKRKLTDGVYDEDAGDETWCYTFTGISDDNLTLIDGTILNTSEYFYDESTNLYKNNKIGIYEYRREYENYNINFIQQCNNIVFIGNYHEEGYGGEGSGKLVRFSFDNILGAQCDNNTIGNSFNNNTIGNDFSNNTIGNSFNNNTIGNDFRNNTIGNSFNNNTIGNDFRNNTIGNNFNNNTIGNDFRNNSIGDNFYYNSIGNYFYNNTIGDNFYYNTIGHNVTANNIGSYFRSNTIGNNVSYITLSVDGTWSSEIRYLYLNSGLIGVSSANKLDLYFSGLYNRIYPTTIKRIANGNIVSIHQETPLVWEGKKKIANTSSIWSSVPEQNGNYVRFLSGSSRTIIPKYTNSDVTLQYSVDSGATWTTIASDDSTTSATEHWFRGQATGTKSLFIGFTPANAWTFSGNSDLEVYGNLNFLLCDTLGDEVAPTNLANNCYNNMFNGCTSLKVAPELPATTLGNYCYHAMFNDCTSLTTAPELPATTLATNCYRQMFGNCTSLTTVPELPATTLADNCYQYMFVGCTSLRVSETNTGSYIYPWRIPTSGTGTTATNWNTYMINGTRGTFKSNPTIDTTYYVQNKPI